MKHLLFLGLLAGLLLADASPFSSASEGRPLSGLPGSLLVGPPVQWESGAIAAGPVPLTEVSMGGGVMVARRALDSEAEGSSPSRPTNAPFAWHPEPMRGPNEILFSAELEKSPVPIPMGLAEVSVKLIDCESSWDSSKEGPLSELGFWQVFPQAHEKEMEEQGLNIHSEYDRTTFVAQTLYPRDGLVPWQSSKDCWEGR